MFSSKTLVLLGLLVPFTLAQYGGGPAAPAPKKTTPAAGAVAAPTSASASAAATHTIVAGAMGIEDLTFTPPTVQALAGEFVEFHFNSNNHSVAQSTLAAPCSPANGSFFAGFEFNTASGPSNNSYVLAVTGTEPIYFYCPQVLLGFVHCKLGMVGIINPPSPQTQAQFKAAAVNATFAMPTTIMGGSIVNASTTAAASPTPTKSAANHLTVGMGFMGLIGIGFSALLSL